MQNQQADIVRTMIHIVRETLGANVLMPQAEKEIETRLRSELGGQELYVKKSDCDVEARALGIRARYNMCNRRELQAEYGISRAQFYKILKGG